MGNLSQHARKNNMFHQFCTLNLQQQQWQQQLNVCFPCNGIYSYFIYATYAFRMCIPPVSHSIVVITLLCGCYVFVFILLFFIMVFIRLPMYPQRHTVYQGFASTFFFFNFSSSFALQDHYDDFKSSITNTFFSLLFNISLQLDG